MSVASPLTLDAPHRAAGTVQAWQRHLPYLLLFMAGTAFLMTLSLLSHRALNTGYDLGIYDQTIWNLSQGRIWRTTLVYETGGYYDHFEPILLFLVPLYWLWPDVRVLLIVQALALGLGSLPIYLYALHRLTPTTRLAIPVALAIAGAYLAFPALHHANLNDFHEVALLPPLLGFALYGLLMGRRRLMFVFLALSLLVKEDVSVTALAFGGYIMLFNPRGFRRRDGVLLATFAVVWALLVLYLFYPALTRGMPYPFVSRRYAWLADSPEGALRVLLTQPWVVLPHLLQWPKLQFLVRLFAPLLFLPLLGWPVILLAFPILSYLMLSSYEAQWSVESYYNPPLLPILFFALIEVLHRVRQRMQGRGELTQAGLTLAVLISVPVSYVVDAPGPGSRLYDAQRFEVSAEDRDLYRLIEQIPPDASVAAIWRLVPHLSHREQIYTTLARPDEPPDYLVDEQWPGAQHAPVFPYAAPRGWPPVYHEYDLVESAGVVNLLRLRHSVSLATLSEREPPAEPLSLVAYGWLDSPDPTVPPAVGAGHDLRLVVAWRRTGPLDRRYVFFLHLLEGEASDDGSQARIAQNDHEPGAGRFPTIYWEDWTAPSIVLDEQRLTLPPETMPGEYEVWAGAYDQETGERIELGNPGESLVLLGRLNVGAALGR